MMDSLCRTCRCQLMDDTKGDYERVSIFETTNFAQKLIQCTNLEIELYDGYPSFVCTKCFAEVLSFYEFQNMCRDSVAVFTKMLERNTEMENGDATVASVENDSNIAVCNAIPIDQIDVQWEKCETFELTVEDPLSSINSPVEQKIEIEEHTLGTKQDESFKASNNVKETSTTLQAKQTKKKKNSIEEAKVTLAKETAEEVFPSNEKLETNDNSEANSSDDDNSLSDSSAIEQNSRSRGCNICQKKFRSQRLFKAHMRIHQKLGNYPCIRKNCTRTFDRFSQWQRHLNDHDGGVPRKIYQCDGEDCDQTYTTTEGLRKHKLKHHSDTPPKREVFMCETCGTVVSSQRSLRDHRYLHMDKSEWPFVCDVCSKKFRNTSALIVHKKRHDGIKNYFCPHCDMRFVTKNNLTTHINSHTWEKTWSCEICPKVCTTPANLRTHVRNCHGDKSDKKPKTPLRLYQCNYCDKGNLTLPGLKYHKRTHTGEKPHVCRECGKKFTGAPNLKMHMRTHMADPPRDHVCGICKRTFSQAQHLKHHLMKHKGEKPYKCEECGLSFRWMQNLKRHMGLHERDRQNEKIEEEMSETLYADEENVVIEDFFENQLS